MTTETTLPMGRDRVEAIATANKEPEWLKAKRLEALELAGRLELPKLEKTRIDRWNIDQYGTYKQQNAIASIAELPEDIQATLTEEEANNLVVQRNSNVVYGKLAKEFAEQGVIFMDLHQAASEHPELVKNHLMTVVKADEHRLTALHAAIWNGGVFLYVPKNVQVSVPMQALFLTDDADASFSPHILVVAEANSSVTYVDQAVSAGSGEPIVHNSVVEVVARAGAQVRFASIHSFGNHVTDFSIRRADLSNDAKVEWIIGEMNDGNCASDTSSLLTGNGSFSDAKVICVGTNDQKLNITTRAVHIGKNSQSDMITRAVMRDEATAIINGITKIEKGATNSNGEQTERVLMLSPKARGDANPMLLIDEDEVKAGHAASVGQVNKEHVHYLMSRGIPREDAERLIIYGFLTPIVSEIPIEKLEKHLGALVERKLGR